MFDVPIDHAGELAPVDTFCADYVHVEDRGGIRWIRLERPAKRNALTNTMLDVLAEALGAASDAQCRAVVLCAHGADFSVGLDFDDAFGDPQFDDDAPLVRFLLNLAMMDIPVIAAVRGLAQGIAATMLLHCDIVYVSPTARLRLPHIELGLVPEAASTLLLPRRIGRARAGAAFFLGEVIDAQRACSEGIVTNMVADDLLENEAFTAARKIASRRRQAVRYTKRLLAHDLEEVLETVRSELLLRSRILTVGRRYPADLEE